VCEAGAAVSGAIYGRRATPSHRRHPFYSVVSKWNSTRYFMNRMLRAMDGARRMRRSSSWAMMTPSTLCPGSSRASWT
jgi:hypothetical protein